MVEPLDHESGTPLYQQLADIVAAKIHSGELVHDRPIPAETRLAEEYGVARLTARRAVRELRERGLVRTVHGKGTFVQYPADRRAGQSLGA
ncbi:GntR family transcriptional regulator [Actinomadura macrotermitis]|uniref:HTH-type transcriptional repressor YvoA n=1 Tax=Actinomadura macrotermitis TaxID=2585200 RepID=A0A7K0BW42_9ACTN|nr:GntR family transcriptional regulator [Actinomadura macrotermitis]MQY05389.1 HTH-type transcriptional repressor YvoA [Actinomadura macrotermitis]